LQKQHLFPNAPTGFQIHERISYADAKRKYLEATAIKNGIPNLQLT